MGRLTVNGLDGIIDDFSELAKLPDSVITDILNGKIREKRQGQKRPKRAVYYRISAGEPQARRAFHTQCGNCVYQRVRGARTAYRRPAISTANAKKENEAIDAGEKIYHDYLDSKK